MSISVRLLDHITRFNGINILQTHHYIKLHAATYIAKILHAQGSYDNCAIKLSQYCTCPAAKVHYLAIWNTFYYLWATINDGIYYWHQNLVMALLDASLPHLFPDN
jgi:hypothetical protein